MPKFRRYTSGDKPAFTASQLNAFNEAALAHAQGKSQTLKQDQRRTRTGNHFPVANSTDDDLPAYSVLELQRALIEPADDENAYKSAIQFNGIKPVTADTLKIAVTQQFISGGGVDEFAVVSGVTFVRLNGATGATAAKVVANSHALTADDAGGIVILYDPGEDTGERIAIAKLAGGATAASGGSSGGGGLATNNCCSSIYLAGSVDLDGLEWATDYTITLAAPIGTVTVTDQGSGTWASDAIEVSCTVDEVTVTDEYTVTMTATGNAPGEVIVTVALTLGGGYGGAAGCCETTEAGFAWKFVNCCIVDPLAGWSMTRDPSGFSGRECEIGGCEICVTPRKDSVVCAAQDYSRKYQVNIDGISGNPNYLDAGTTTYISCVGSCPENLSFLCEYVDASPCQWQSPVVWYTPECTAPKQYSLSVELNAVYTAGVFEKFTATIIYYNDDWVNTFTLKYSINAAGWSETGVNVLSYDGLEADRVDSQMQCIMPLTVEVLQSV